MLGGPEQVSATSEAAGGDSRRGDFAAPAETELYYMEKFIEKYRMEKDGRQILPLDWLRRRTALDPDGRAARPHEASDRLGALSLIMNAATRLA